MYAQDMKIYISFDPFLHEEHYPEPHAPTKCNFYIFTDEQVVFFSERLGPGSSWLSSFGRKTIEAIYNLQFFLFTTSQD